MKDQPTIKKSLQDVVNLIVALNYPGQNEDYYKPWEVYEMLLPFAWDSVVEDIRERNEGEAPPPRWELEKVYSMMRTGVLYTYPDDIKRLTTLEERAEIKQVLPESVFWVNLKDNPWSDSDYVGWKYVVTFPNGEYEGKYLVREDNMFIPQELIRDTWSDE